MILDDDDDDFEPVKPRQKTSSSSSQPWGSTASVAIKKSTRVVKKTNVEISEGKFNV
jgi:hypothetical protein